jgi:hypothetical protein
MGVKQGSEGRREWEGSDPNIREAIITKKGPIGPEGTGSM